MQAAFRAFRLPERYTNSGKCRCSCSGVRLGAISSSSSSQATATKSGATSLARSKSSVARRQARGKHWRKRSYKSSQSASWRTAACTLCAAALPAAPPSNIYSAKSAPDQRSDCSSSARLAVEPYSLWYCATTRASSSSVPTDSEGK